MSWQWSFNSTHSDASQRIHRSITGCWAAIAEQLSSRPAVYCGITGWVPGLVSQQMQWKMLSCCINDINGCFVVPRSNYDSIAKMAENGKNLAERLVQSQTAPSSRIELSSGGIGTADSYKCCSLGCSSASDTVMHNGIMHSNPLNMERVWVRMAKRDNVRLRLTAESTSNAVTCCYVPMSSSYCEHLWLAWLRFPRVLLKKLKVRSCPRLF